MPAFASLASLPEYNLQRTFLVPAFRAPIQWPIGPIGASGPTA